MRFRHAAAIAGILLLPACGDKPGAVATATAPAPPGLDAHRVAHGAELYRTHCATCHGANAEGAPSWQRKGPDGKLPPPPLDASGHSWHHPRAWLHDMIRQGTVSRGGNMPAWQGKLNDRDIEAVVAWIHSRWPEEIYRQWLAVEEKARAGHAH